MRDWRKEKEQKTSEENKRRRRQEKRREEMIQKMHAREIGKPRSCVFSILCPRIPSAKDLGILE